MTTWVRRMSVGICTSARRRHLRGGSAHELAAAEWLQQAGYRPRSETTCSAGRDLTADLIVLSIRNPKQRGSECVNAIRAAHPGKPIIAISGQFRLGVPADGDVAQALGVQRVMAKPLLRA